MSIKDLLANVVDYYSVARRCGHTRCMMNGAKDEESVIIVAADAQHKRNLKVEAPKAIILTHLALERKDILHGESIPIAFDNHSLAIIFAKALHRINELERENSNHAENIARAKAVLSEGPPARIGNSG